MGTRRQATFHGWRLRPLAAAIVAAGALTEPDSRAASLVVTTLAESSLAACTLRDAIDSINGQADQGACTASGAYGTADTVGFASGLTGTITFFTADPLANPVGSSALVVRRSMSIFGPGSGSLTLQCGNLTARLLEIDATAAPVDLAGLTIANCHSNLSGAGIVASLSNAVPSLQLTDVTLRSNQASMNGGGMAVFGVPGATVTMTACTIDQNIALVNGGGVFVSQSDLNVTDSSLSRNRAVDGGGAILQGGGSVTFTRSTVQGNRANSFGGGLLLIGPSGALSLFDSTVSANQATNGGGVALLGIFQPQQGFAATNSTFSGNSAANGGGLYMLGGNAGSLALANSTVAANKAWGVMVENTITSGGMTPAGVVDIVDTIIAGNAPGDMHSSEPGQPGGVMTWDVSWSLIGDPDNVPLNGTGNVIGGLPPFGPGGWLGPLQNNGGPTLTHALLTSVPDPAIDAGDPLFSGLKFDQRGKPFKRVLNGRVDIGAFEAAATASASTSAGEPIPAPRGVLLAMLSGLLAWLGWRLRPRR